MFVWIYGGANAAGMGHDPAFDGTSFAKNGVVYVTFNYRVGPMGFYDFSIYDDSFESNCGVADQIAALRWVKENIAAFGGDPDCITICGQSAGGTAVYDMLTAPAAKGLFHRAIAQSGPAASGCERERTTRLNMELYLNKLGITPAEIHKLREMTPEELKPAAQWLTAENNLYYPGIFVPGPVQDDLLPEYPWEALAKGSAEGVDVIFGATLNEGTLFTARHMFPINWEEIGTMLESSGHGDKLPAFKRLYGHLSESDAAALVAGDRAFWADSVRCADAQVGHGKVYAYRFDFVTPVLQQLGFGATHGADTGYMLNTNGLTMQMYCEGAPEEKLQKMRSVCHGAWVNFCKSGDPNGDHLPVAWTPYDAETRPTYIFNDTCTVEQNPRGEFFDLWKDIRLYE